MKDKILNWIKEKLIKSKIYDRTKDYSKDKHKVSVYFDIGKFLSEADNECEITC